jgi:NAD(P)-dependent dehydrogenase (short-subunit alcohol dehydrogenase family)
MTGRLEGQVAIVVGAGQSPGESVGNGRASALTYAREGARVLCVDRNVASAEETAGLIVDEGGGARSFEADATSEAALQEMVATCVREFGRIDILHNNVGISLTGNDAPITEITEEAFDRCMAVNLKSMVLACKHVLPVMRDQESGVITNISSAAAKTAYPLIAYKVSKAAVVALTENVAVANAAYGIRCNTILPGLVDTPMGVDSRVREMGLSREEVVAMRRAKVPLKGHIGTGWDVANAALFLASKDAGYITGISLLVDGGRSLGEAREKGKP